MSENILIFIITGVATFLVNLAIYSFKLGGLKASIQNDIETIIYTKLNQKIDRIYQELKVINDLENSLIELNAKLEMSNQKCDHDFQVINERVTNLKNNVRSKIQDLRHTQNELANYIQKELNPSRAFIIRNRSKETISEFDEDSWTQIHG